MTTGRTIGRTALGATTVDASMRRPPLWRVLLRHEWRLTTREFGGRARSQTALALRKGSDRWGSGVKVRVAGLATLFVLLHLAGALGLLLPRHLRDTQATRIGATAVLLFLFTLMLSIAMSRIVTAFHERRDLDLLLGAPIAPSLILVVRALTVVAAVTVLFAFFVYPLADVGVASGRWWMARLYPLVPLMAVACTGIALVVTGAVVRLIGVRRARVGLQLFSAFVGASFYLVSQARQFLPIGAVTTAKRWIDAATRDDTASWPVLFAARIAGGDGLAWLAFAVGAASVLAASVWFARERFLEVAQTPEADAPVTRPARNAVDRRIRSSFVHRPFAALMMKEWQLILRSPQLLSQVLLQLLYLVPLMFVAIGRGGTSALWGPVAFASGIVGVAATLATSLSWLTVAAEDAPDLLAGSPMATPTILAAKLMAAAAPPVALLLTAALAMSRRSVPDATIVFVVGTLACISAAILSAASPTSAKRSDFQRRHRGRGAMAVVEAFQFLLWAGATGAAVGGWWLAGAALTVAALAMPAIYLPRALRQLGGADR